MTLHISTYLRASRTLIGKSHAAPNDGLRVALGGSGPLGSRTASGDSPARSRTAGDDPHPGDRDWIRCGHPLCLIGDSGTGKSHLLIALGTVAAERASGSATPLRPIVDRLTSERRDHRKRHRLLQTRAHQEPAGAATGGHGWVLRSVRPPQRVSLRRTSGRCRGLGYGSVHGSCALHRPQRR